MTLDSQDYDEDRILLCLLPLALLRKVERTTAQVVAYVVIEFIKSLQVRTHTVTVDNGKEFADHMRIARELNTDVYLAHPCESWERTTKEKNERSCSPALSEEAQLRNAHSD